MNGSVSIWRRVSGVAWTPLATALTVCLLVAVAHAQGDGDSKAVPLPTAIKLTLRGKPGDLFTYKTTVHGSSLLNISAFNQNFSAQESTELAWTCKLRGPGQNSTLLVEVRTMGNTVDRITRNQQSTTHFPPIAGLFTFTPALETRSLVSLRAEAPAKTPGTSGSKSGKKTNTSKRSVDASTSTQGLARLLDLYNPIPFPTKTVHMGDTWTGVIPADRFSGKEKKDPEFPFKATLVAIELYRDIPCAKVEYDVQYKGRIPSLEAMVVKHGPKGTRISGSGDTRGKITAYYTLDRGALLDQETHIQIQYLYQLTVPNPSGGDPILSDADATFDSEEQTSATDFPPYDVSLLSAVAPAPGTPASGGK